MIDDEKIPYNFEITDRSYFAFNMFYHVANIIAESLKCYIEEIKKRNDEGIYFSMPDGYDNVEDYEVEINKIIEGFIILGDDYHPLNMTNEGYEKINYSMEKFKKLFPTMWI